MRTFLHRLRHLLARQQFEDDLAEEMEFHRAMKQRELEDDGETPEAAAAASRRAMGNMTLAREHARDAWVWPWLSESVRDVRYGVRMLRRAPAFTAVAVLTLALGIGANTAIFSLLDVVLLRSLPVPHPQELLFFGRAAAAGSTGFTPNGDTQLFSYRFVRDFRRENRVFSDVAAIGSIVYRSYGRVATGADLERMNVELVSGGYFNTLGVSAIAGRTIGDGDDQTPGGHPIAVASDAWVQRRFGRVEGIVGSTVSIGSRVYTIVGVAPPRFSGVTVGQSPDLWIPLAMQREISPGWNGLDDPMFQTLHLVARVKPGVSLAQAQTATNLLFRHILRDYVGPHASERRLANIQRAYITLTPASTGRSELRRQFSSPLLILMAAVGIVLLIACANIANLLLARAAARQREIAVRMSLGAGRWRLVRQLLTESLLLGLVGGAIGLLLATGASRLLMALVSPGTESLPLAVGPDVTVLAFTLAVASVAVMVFGLAPALQATRLTLAASLKDGGSVVSSARSRLSRSLVVSEIALSLTLVAGALLFLRSLANLTDLDTGFEKRHVLVGAIEPGSAGYTVDDRLESMMTRVEQRVASIPGVHGASFVYFAPFDGGSWSTDDIVVPGRRVSDSTASVNVNLVGPQYLDIMKMPIVAGRGLSSRDTAASPRVAVINETMARTYFGEPFPIGRTFTVRDDEKATDFDGIEVVGVVKDAKYVSFAEAPTPAAFFPHAQHHRNFLFTFVVRHDGEPAAIVPAIRRAVADVDANLPLGDITTLERIVDDSVVNRRAVAQLSAVFGSLAILLACIGIYGVTSYGIARRANEFGVRVALGATALQLLWLVVADIVRTAALGVAIGLVITLAFGRVVSSLLFGLTPHDPAIIGVAVVTMIAVALLAGILPARRATRIDPLVALRHA